MGGLESVSENMPRFDEEKGKLPRKRPRLLSKPGPLPLFGKLAQFAPPGAGAGAGRGGGGAGAASGGALMTSSVVGSGFGGFGADGWAAAGFGGGGAGAASGGALMTSSVVGSGFFGFGAEGWAAAGLGAVGA